MCNVPDKCRKAIGDLKCICTSEVISVQRIKMSYWEAL